MAVPDSEDAVRSVVMDYVAGWFEGDAGRMKRALHPELVKRCKGIEGDDPGRARDVVSAGHDRCDGSRRRTPEDAADRQIEIRIDHLSAGSQREVLLHRYFVLLT